MAKKQSKQGKQKKHLQKRKERDQKRTQQKLERIRTPKQQHQEIKKQLAQLNSLGEQLMARLPEDVRKKIERNIEILRGLEAEYAQEMERKRATNAALEKDGHMTLHEKVDAAIRANMKDNEDPFAELPPAENVVLAEKVD